MAYFERAVNHLGKDHRAGLQFASFPHGRTVVAGSLSRSTLLPLHNVLQKTGACCPPVVLYKGETQGGMYSEGFSASRK